MNANYFLEFLFVRFFLQAARNKLFFLTYRLEGAGRLQVPVRWKVQNFR